MPPRGLSLPSGAAAKLLSGAPIIDLGLLGEKAAALEPGRPLILLDASGSLLGSGIADPENEVIRVLAREAVDSFDASFFRRRALAALELRRALSLPGPNRAFRLLNGEGDGLSGFVADVYGDFVVLYVYSRGLINLGRILAQAILETAAPRGVVLKVRPRSGPTPGKVKQEVIGEEPPEKLVVDEGGVPHEVHLLSGINVGLFTDMREHRRGLHRFTRGRRVLNTFAYTGSLSVAAALGGAAEVTSVDLSSGVLKWARENFRLSSLDPEDARYRFVEDDVLRFCRSEKARGAAYDMVILDPPTYSAARAAGWSMKNDYPDLIAAATDLLPPGRPGFLWASANVQRARALSRHIEEGMGKRRREVKVLETGGLPPDYPTPLEYPEARYLEVCYLEVI
ncbi:MAG TPA: class I SAM-dependent rRNA methyltransferase [Planctomycetota bacterium]|nr:class I SAM-dependent rRNA methyltransferase [Planctomycetota bacterium]